MMSFSLSGGVEVLGFISPTDPLDTYPVIDPIYGIDGFRNVNLISDLDLIPNSRRRSGMVVGVSGGTEYYKLNPSPWNGDITDWDIFFSTPITGVTNVGTGLTIFDSVIDKTVRLNTINGDTLDKIVTTISNNTIHVGINEQNLDLWPLVVQGNRLLNGGVSYISGLTFNVSSLDYIIDGTIYKIPTPTTVILNSGDTLYDRIDVIVANINGNTSVIEGTPSSNPEKPDINESTDVELTFVLIQANSVTADINGFVIYNENSGPPNEWTFGSGGPQSSRIIGSSTGETYSGTTSIRVSGVTTPNYGTYFRLTGSTPIDTNNYSTLQFALKNLSANTTTNRVRIRFLTTGGTQNGSVVYMNAAGSSGYVQYSSNNVSNWQLISIPLWRFYLTNTNVQVVEIAFSPIGGTVTSNYYFDLVEFVEGTSSSPPSNSWTTIKGDSTSTIVAPNPNATLTISGGTNINSSISGTSTVVLNLDNNISLNSVGATTISGNTFYGDGSNLTGITLPINCSNVIFVDSVNGNDATGLVNRFDKPFLSLSSACSAALALSRSSTNKALIYVRRGYYFWNGYLMDYCDFYSEPGVTYYGGGRISEQTYGSAVNSNFLGYAELLNVDIFVRYGSTIKFQFSKMINNIAAFLFIPLTGVANVTVEADYIYANTIGTSYLATVRGPVNLTVNVKEKIESPYTHWNFRNSFSGTFVLNCPQSFLLSGGTYTGSKQIVYATDTTSTAKMIVNGDFICTDPTYYGGPSGLVALWGYGSGYFEMNGNLYSGNNIGLYSNISNASGRGVINGSISSDLRPIASVNVGKATVKNGTILCTSNLYEPVYVGGTSVLYLMNCFIVGATDTSITKIDSSTSGFSIYNCIGYSAGSLGNCVTATTPGYFVRIHNFRTNKPLSANVTDILSPTGLIVDVNTIAPNY